MRGSCRFVRRLPCFASRFCGKRKKGRQYHMIAPLSAPFSRKKLDKSLNVCYTTIDYEMALTKKTQKGNAQRACGRCEHAGVAFVVYHLRADASSRQRGGASVVAAALRHRSVSREEPGRRVAFLCRAQNEWYRGVSSSHAPLGGHGTFFLKNF